ALLNVHSKELDSLANVKPGDEAAAASKLLQEAVGAGVGAHFAAVITETLYPTKNPRLPQMGALMAEPPGFGGIIRGIIGPEMRALVAQPHTYKTNERARSMYPNEMAALALYARRLINDTKVETLLGYAGLTLDYVAETKESAYRAMQPRALAALYQDV